MKDYLTGIQHIGIPTKNMDATLSFYNALGFESAYETTNNGAKVRFLKLGNLVIEAYESDDAVMKGGAIDHIAIDVTDVEAVYNKICEMDMNNLEDQIQFLPFWENGVRFFKIKGPNEEILEFSQYM